MLKNRPALKFCIPFILGVTLGWEFNLPLIPTLIGLLSLVTLHGFLSFRRSPSDYLAPLLFVLIVIFGIAKITFDAKSQPANLVGFFASSEGKTATVRGTISDLPTKRGNHYSFVIEADSLFCDSQKLSVEGGVSVTLYRDSLSPALLRSMTYGKTILLNGTFLELAPIRNPNDFEYRRYLMLNDIYARLSLQHDSDIVVSTIPENAIAATIIYPVRGWVNRVIETLMSGEEAKLMKGLVLGERQEMSPDVKAAFINAGLMHILAVSGFNVGLVVLILYAGLSLFRLPPLAKVIIASICLIYFGFITGAQASVFRAVIMAIVFLSAKLLQRKADLMNTLSLAAVCLLLIDSRGLFDVGFQLSFLAVAGLAYFYPKFHALAQHLPEITRSNIVLRYLVASVIVSLAATVGTLPISAYYFQKISIAGIGMNLIAVPLSGIILGLGFAAVAASTFSLWVGSCFALPANLLSKFLLMMTVWSGYSSFAFVETHITIFMVACLYLFVLLLYGMTKENFRKRLVLIALMLGNTYIYASILTPNTKYLRITCLDIGQGDAIFLEFPDGKNALVDTGPYSPSNDAGERFIVPYLQHRGIKKLDYLIISHPHSDHIGGAGYLFRHVTVGEVIDAGSRSTSFLAREYMHLIDSMRINHRIIVGGSAIDESPSLRIYALHPTGKFVPSDSMEKMGLNNQSLVLKIIYGKTSILMEGDAQAEAEEQMHEHYGSFLSAEVLKVGHHGSKTSSSPLFLNAVNPRFALISVGRNNKFQHPNPGTLERLRRRNCAYFRTDLSGASILESDGARWSLIRWR